MIAGRALVVVATSIVLAGGLMAPAAGAGQYVVKPGDTFGAVARRHGLSQAELSRLNPQVTNVNLLRIGVTLEVGSGTTTTASTQTEHISHQVASGENLSQIARRYGVTVEDIVRQNGLRNANVVRAGAVLSIDISLGGKASYPRALRRSPERLALVPHFDAAAQEFGVPADLLKSMAWYESGWRNSARSSVGAIGIGQLMPGTAAYVAELMGEHGLDPSVPVDNIRMSAWYLRYVLRRYDGNARNALMAYNQGWARLDADGPTRLAIDYADTILEQRAMF